ncbi:hypothetical protein AA105894_2396 [Asaia spathodeae NBRC 105894]|nr:hypothetical protein AA105894_2396 [Asaia spathodeae NBRC 105894]
MTNATDMTGHNSGMFFDPDAAAANRARQAADPESNVGGIAVDRLRSVIERVERLEEERKALAADIKDIFSEAKSAGFDVATIKNIIKLRKKEPNEIEEQETLLSIYRRALGC